MPTPCRVYRVQAKYVSRVINAADLSDAFLLKNATGEATTGHGTPGTSYSGFVNTLPIFTEPDGSAWERADADASATELGVQAANNPSFATNARVTLLPTLEWWYYTASHALTTTPSAARRAKPMQVLQAVNRASTY